MLLADGHTVVGIDNLNDAYDVRLKHWRFGASAQDLRARRRYVVVMSDHMSYDWMAIRRRGRLNGEELCKPWSKQW